MPHRRKRECYESCDIFRCAQAPKRDIPEERLQLRLVLEERLLMGVEIAPGATLLTLMPSGPSSTARSRIEHAETTLAAAVRREPRERHIFMNRADVDDAAGFPGLAQP